MRLNKRNVEAIPVPAYTQDKHGRTRSAQTFRWDDDLRGFGVKVNSGGSRVYVAQARVNGRTRRTKLGAHGQITAEVARQRARAELGRMSGGTDPSAERQRERALSVTLRQVADSYQRDRRDLKESTRRDIRKHLAGAFKAWADRPVAEITREKVTQRFRELSDHGPAQANQAFRVLRALLNYARAQYRTPEGEPVLPDNPVGVLSEARMWNRVQPRNSYVPLERIGRWWSAVQARRADPALTPLHRTTTDLVAFLTLTGLRLGEASALRWDQLDLDDASLTLADTKNRDTITLPLSSGALSILSDRNRESEFVFPGKGGGHVREVRGALTALANATEIEVTAHDLRRTFRAVAGAVGLELWVTKALMNHRQTQDVTLSAYTDTSDVRRLWPQADAVADYLEQQRRIYEGENIVQLQGAAAE